MLGGAPDLEMCNMKSSAAAAVQPDRGSVFVPTYKRSDVTISRGEGAWLFADDGRRLLDFAAGVAVTNMGHNHPAIMPAARAQFDKAWHVSNHFWTEPMVGLARRLITIFSDSQVFFTNSGAEANEAVIKYARKATGRSGIVALHRSFHGRTCGALSVTGQPAKRDMFYPLLPNVTFVEANDAAALREAITSDVGLVIMEPIQGEAGIYPITEEFASVARLRTREVGALLAFDEIQTGMGRTGTFFGHEAFGVRPDLLSIAKGLANGLPMGAMLVANEAGGGFGPGDHATTFGGNPVAAAAGCAVIDALDDRVLANVSERGARIMGKAGAFSKVRNVRGRGLLIGLDLGEPVDAAVRECRNRNLVVTAAGATTLRLSPPLIIGDEEERFALEVLAAVLN